MVSVVYLCQQHLCSYIQLLECESGILLPFLGRDKTKYYKSALTFFARREIVDPLMVYKQVTLEMVFGGFDFFDHDLELQNYCTKYLK